MNKDIYSFALNVAQTIVVVILTVLLWISNEDIKELREDLEVCRFGDITPDYRSLIDEYHHLVIEKEYAYED